MGVLSNEARRCGVSPELGKVSAACVLLLGLGALGSVQAATLSCGPGATPVRVNTANSSQWSTDARYVAAPHNIATIIDNYRWSGWLNLSTNPNHPANPPRSLAGQPLQGKWLSFGATADEVTPGQYPAVNTVGVVANGAWVAGRATFTYNEPITIGPNVNLATIKIQGSGSADNSALLAVRPTTLPGGVNNMAAATPWTQTASMLGGTWGALAAINLDGSTSGLGFYYGDNTIGLALSNEPTTQTYPTGIVADFEITADCLTPVPPPPTTALMCPMGNQAGQTIRIGPFHTSARDWKWTWRNQTAGSAVENVVQPLFDDFIWRSYFKPASLTGANATAARWISPGTVDPSGADIPGVPYPMAQGQAPQTVLTLNQPITVGNNVDLSSIKLDGRFGFDNLSAGVFVQPAGKPAPTTFTPIVSGGYASFATSITPVVPGFLQGQNTLGLAVNGGEASNNCPGGGCAVAAIADFYVTATCTGDAPIVPGSTTHAVPALNIAGLGLLSLLSAGLGALGLRRRKNAQ